MNILRRKTSAPMRPLKLNIGCGPIQPPGWVNVDGSNRAWLASKLPWLDGLLVWIGIFPATEFNRQTFFANLARRWPWRNESVDAIYGGEVLEHFTYQQGQRLLEECCRILKPGGVLRLRVPDNALFWENYLNEFHATRQKPPSQWTLDHTRWIEMFFREICVRPRLLRSVGHYHKWMYDEVSLTKALQQARFTEVQAMAFRQSRIDDIVSVEVRNDLIVEGTKP